METPLHSDFHAARLHLDKACHALRGNDDASRKLRDALDLMIEAVATAEHAPVRGEVVAFPRLVRNAGS